MQISAAADTRFSCPGCLRYVLLHAQCTAHCRCETWENNKQPFSRPGSPRAQQPQRSGILLVRRCIPWALKAGQKSPLRWSCQALTWFYGGSCHCSWHPWVAAPKAIISTADHITWAGGAGCSKCCWCWGGESYSLPTLPSHLLLQKAPWQSACHAKYVYILNKDDRGESPALSPWPNSAASTSSFLALCWTFPTSCLQNSVWACVLRWLIPGLLPNVTVRLIWLDRTVFGSLHLTSSPALSQAALQPHMPLC